MDTNEKDTAAEATKEQLANPVEPVVSELVSPKEKGRVIISLIPLAISIVITIVLSIIADHSASAACNNLPVSEQGECGANLLGLLVDFLAALMFIGSILFMIIYLLVTRPHKIPASK